MMCTSESYGGSAAGDDATSNTDVSSHSTPLYGVAVRGRVPCGSQCRCCYRYDTDPNPLVYMKDTLPTRP